jgi:hypothetical protein
MNERNFNEFQNRAGTRAKTLLSLVRDVVDGNQQFTYRDLSALRAEWRPTKELTGQRLRWIFEPLRILPVLVGDKVLFINQLDVAETARLTWGQLFDVQWMVASAA